MNRRRLTLLLASLLYTVACGDPTSSLDEHFDAGRTDSLLDAATDVKRDDVRNAARTDAIVARPRRAEGPDRDR